MSFWHTSCHSIQPEQHSMGNYGPLWCVLSYWLTVLLYFLWWGNMLIQRKRHRTRVQWGVDSKLRGDVYTDTARDGPREHRGNPVRTRTTEGSEAASYRALEKQQRPCLNGGKGTPNEGHQRLFSSPVSASASPFLCLSIFLKWIQAQARCDSNSCTALWERVLLIKGDNL